MLFYAIFYLICWMLIQLILNQPSLWQYTAPYKETIVRLYFVLEENQKMRMGYLYFSLKVLKKGVNRTHAKYPGCKKATSEQNEKKEALTGAWS